MYRWVTKLDHLVDNLANGWRTTERPIRFSARASAALIESLGEPELVSAGSRLIQGGRILEVLWSGVSFTSSGPGQFTEDTYDIFGQFSLQMSAKWMRRQRPVTPIYLTDSHDDIALLLERVGSANCSDDLHQVLVGFDRNNLGGEAEVRVLATTPRIPFNVRSDVLQVFVPSEDCAVQVSSRFSLVFSPMVIPQPKLPDLPDDLWSEDEDQ